MPEPAIQGLGPSTPGDAEAPQHDRLSRFLDRVPEGTIVVDDEGRIRLANARAAEIFGYGAGELVGRSVEDLMPSSERARHREARAGFTRQPRDRTMGSGPVILAQRKDGSCFRTSIELRPRNTPSGLVTLTVVRDLGEAELGDQAWLVREVQRRSNLVRLAAEDLEELSTALLSALSSLRKGDRDEAERRTEEAWSAAYLVHELALQLVAYGSEEVPLRDPERDAK